MYESLPKKIKLAGGRGLRDLEDAGALDAISPRRLLATLALQDVLLIGYLAAVTACLLCAEPNGLRAECIDRNLTAIAILVLACAFARRVTAVAPAIRRNVYRAVLVGTVLFNYLSLRTVLPIVRGDSVDKTLLRIDLLLFGVEPALWLERFNVRPVVEWFSFFYFSYFFICLICTATAVWLRRPNRATTEFTLGTALVYCVGQLGYMAVPGFGPVQALRDAYRGPLDGGFFWSCVNSTVQAGGAMKDVFPSLHTAAPLWFTLHAFRCARADRRFFWPAVVSAFFSLNIIVSTMLLRWHYAIDVVAGAALAVSSALLATRLARWEEASRARLGEAAPWSLE